jgi:hypothetical protein
MSAFVLTVLIGFGAWFWANNLRAREMAIAISAEACKSSGVQFLDQTVEQKKLWIARSKQGHLCFCRSYTFEFTTTGEQRYQGRILIVGGKITKSDLDVYRVHD